MVHKILFKFLIDPVDLSQPYCYKPWPEHDDSNLVLWVPNHIPNVFENWNA